MAMIKDNVCGKDRTERGASAESSFGDRLRNDPFVAAASNSRAGTARDSRCSRVIPVTGYRMKDLHQPRSSESDAAGRSNEGGTTRQAHSSLSRDELRFFAFPAAISSYQAMIKAMVAIQDGAERGA